MSKYKFAMTEISLGNKTYARCTGCGKWHQTNFGFNLDYAKHGSWGFVKEKFCRKCASIYIPVIEKALEGLHKAMPLRTPEDTSPLGQEIEETIASIIRNPDTKITVYFDQEDTNENA